jgi:hypothetical protein
MNTATESKSIETLRAEYRAANEAAREQSRNLAGWVFRPAGEIRVGDGVVERDGYILSVSWIVREGSKITLGLGLHSMMSRRSITATFTTRKRVAVVPGYCANTAGNW